MSDKEDKWKLAVTKGLVVGELGSPEYNGTTTSQLKKLLLAHETELFTPKTVIIKGKKSDGVDKAMQNENKALQDRISKLEKQNRALVAENSMHVQKLGNLKNSIEAGATPGELISMTKQEDVDEGPRIMVKVLVTSYSIDDRVYVEGDEFLCPQNRFPTTSLKQLEAFKPEKKKLKKIKKKN